MLTCIIFRTSSCSECSSYPSRGSCIAACAFCEYLACHIAASVPHGCSRCCLDKSMAEVVGNTQAMMRKVGVGI